VNAEAQKIELLTAMARRLTAALEADIAALNAGRPQEMRTLDPEIQRLSAAYSREAATLDPARAKSAPAELRRNFVAVTQKFHEAVKLHVRILTRVRNASEGIVKAVAEEVERVRAPVCTYAPAPRGRPTSGAMVYNSVV
jgi:hypothetical protein